MSKTSLLWIVALLGFIVVALAFDIHDKNKKIDKLNDNVITLYNENVTLKKQLGVAKGLLDYVSN